MGGEYTLLIVFATGAIVFSFLCSLWESVLLSISPSYALELNQNSGVGRRLRKFKKNIDVPLAAILTLNTIAHTVGAIGVGDQAVRIWSESNPLITGVVVPVVMTLAILILSEIIPKTIGANYWRQFVPFTVTSLNILVKVLYPLIWLMEFITKGLRKDKSEPVLSRSQFLAMAHVGEEEGVLNEQETEIIKNLLQFREIRVRAVMTPRTVIRMVPQELTAQEFVDQFPDGRFSRIPIYENGDVNAVVGYVLHDDLLFQLSTGDDPALETIRRDFHVVLESLPIPELFKQLLERREHIALIVDEFGDVKGLITMEDVIETMLGLEIVDEKDRSQDMQELARRTWRRRARRLGLDMDQPG